MDNVIYEDEDTKKEVASLSADRIKMPSWLLEMSEYNTIILFKHLYLESKMHLLFYLVYIFFY